MLRLLVALLLLSSVSSAQATYSAASAAKPGPVSDLPVWSTKLTQPFAELLSQTVDHASAEAGAEQAAPKGGNSLLGKLNLKSFVGKKAKEPSSQAA